MSFSGAGTEAFAETSVALESFKRFRIGLQGSIDRLLPSPDDGETGIACGGRIPPHLRGGVIEVAHRPLELGVGLGRIAPELVDRAVEPGEGAEKRTGVGRGRRRRSRSLAPRGIGGGIKSHVAVPAASTTR